MREVPELFRVIQTVPDDEMVRDREADVLDLDVHLPPRRLAQQAGRTKGLRTARAKDVLQVHESQAGIDDVLDDHHVLAVEGGVEVLEKPDLAGRGGTFGV